MNDSNARPRQFHFSVFEVDLRTGELRKQGLKVKLHGQPFHVLAILLERPGEMVTREEIREKLWPGDTFIDFEKSINTSIKRLREALGDDAAAPRFIETLPRHGYRFIAPVQAKWAEGGAPVVAPVSSPAIAIAAASDRRPPVGAVRELPLGRWMVLTLAGIGLTALIAWAAWFHFSRRAREVTNPPMRIVPFTSFPGHQDEARFSPDGNQIAFSWNGEKEDNRDIYVKLIGTEKPLRLTTTTHPGEDHYPAWSPDGRSIAFWRYDSRNEAGIYVVPALGGPERRLHTTNLSGLDLDWDESLDWSPDGKYLAYTEGGGGQRNPTIFLLAVDNPDNIRLLIKPAGQTEDCSPRFSPDGRNVAFVRWMGQPAHDLFVVPLAGGEPKRLTFDNGFIRGLAWTPDGAYVIFSSNRLGGTFRLWKVPPRGGQPEPLPVGQGGAFYPTLSRDGRRLAYTQMDSNVNIWRCEVPRAAGRSAPPTKLIASTYSSLSPQFSPDGKRIVFTSDRSGGLEIWVCDSAGSNPRQLTFFEGPATFQPHWSPDGRQIAFDSSAEGRGAVYVVSVEGGRPRRLTAGASDDGVPTWSRDGKWIYFASDRTGAVQTWKMPAEGGQAVQVTKKGGYVAFESPDGKILYYAKGYADPGLWKVPVGGGEETPVLEQLAEGYRWAWGLGGEGIYFYNASTKAIELLNFATHRIMQIAKPEKPVWTVAVSPDGRWILYDQLDQNTSKIMLVENFRW